MYVNMQREVFPCRLSTELFASCTKKISEDSLVHCRLFLRSRLADQSGGNLFRE